jgi:chemotaxis signal transduction protein
MAHTSRAWVMDVGAGQRVAAGVAHVVEYLLAPETIDVPRTPGYCAGLLIWRDHMIPVIDFASPPLARKTPLAGTRRAVILAYQEAPAQPLRFGALLVTATPTETWVSDDMAGQLEQMPAMFRQVARACFVQQDQTIPILDARQLFTRPLSRLHAAHAELSEPAPSDLEGAPTQLMAMAREAQPGMLSLVQNIQLLSASPSDPPPVLAEETQDGGLPAETWDDLSAIPAAHCRVNLYVLDGGPADSAVTLAESVAPLQARDFPEFLALATQVPAETEFAELPLAEPTAEAAMAQPLHAGEEAALIDVAVATSTVQPAPSTTVRSFQRLHAIAQDIENREHRRHSGLRRGWLIGAGAGLALLAAALLFMPRDHSAPLPVARDVAPNGLPPASVPSTPAQPPQ